MKPSGPAPAAPTTPFWRLCVVNAAILAPIGLQLPFLPLWYAAIGFGAAEIAFIQAAPPLARFAANLVAPPIADRTGRPTLVLLACMACMAACMAAAGFFRSFWSVFALVAAAAFAQGPSFPIGDAIVLRELRRRARAGAAAFDYGVARGAGSISVFALMFAGGWLTGLAAPEAFPWVLAGLTLAMLPAIALLAPPDGDGPDEAGRERARAAGAPAPIARPGLALLTIAAAAAVQASHGALYGLGSVGFAALGFGREGVGLLWAVSVGAEIAFFMLAGRRLDARRRAFALLAFGAGVAVLRWLAMSVSQDAAVLFLLQALHAGSFAATHLGSVYAVAELVGEKRRAQGQGWLAGAVSLATAGAILLSGLLWTRMGAGAYLVMAGLAGAGCLGALWAQFLNGGPARRAA